MGFQSLSETGCYRPIATLRSGPQGCAHKLPSSTPLLTAPSRIPPLSLGAKAVTRARLVFFEVPNRSEKTNRGLAAAYEPIVSRAMTVTPALKILGMGTLIGRSLNLPSNTLELINKNSNLVKDTLFFCQISRI